MEYLLFLLIGITGNVIGTLVGGGGLITLPTMMLVGGTSPFSDWCE